MNSQRGFSGVPIAPVWLRIDTKGCDLYSSDRRCSTAGKATRVRCTAVITKQQLSIPSSFPSRPIARNPDPFFTQTQPSRLKPEYAPTPNRTARDPPSNQTLNLPGRTPQTPETLEPLEG